MKEVLNNAEEFMAAGEDNIKKNRWNAATTDFFKAITCFSDYLIYREIKRLPKTHNDRFSLLKKYFVEIYTPATKLFETYRRSYNNRLTKEEAQAVKDYALILRTKVSH